MIIIIFIFVLSDNVVCTRNSFFPSSFVCIVRIKSKLFSLFTGNRYRKILVKSLGLSELAVELKSGEEKPLEWLSSGTKAQLYLAVRFALAEKSLLGERGFLLLDEPFLGCDEQRIANLVDTLFSFAQDKGWQLIFFTLDRSLKKLFEKRGVKAKVLETKELNKK